MSSCLLLLFSEWTDGLLPVVVRQCVADETHTRKWICFDGVVDTLWIESMNTVLDDNKKLCLTSGEIISLTDDINMVFEVEVSSLKRSFLNFAICF